MELKKKVAEGFAHSYLRNEEKVVIRHLQTGRLDQKEWQQHLKDLEELIEDYVAGEIQPEKFLEKRREKTREFMKTKDKESRGLTREEAMNLYQPLREKHREVIKDAHEESGTTMVELFVRTLNNKLNRTICEARNIN
jgi:hypothetical protein